MKSFSTSNGDVVVNKTIEMVDGSELLRQKVERVIGTNLGEWRYDEKEGIDFRVELTKNPDKNKIRATIEEALVHIDNTFALTEFDMTLVGREAIINFKAINGVGTEVGGEYVYGGN